MRQSVVLRQNQTQLRPDLLEVYKSAMPDVVFSMTVV